jgi:hypothetical protein
MGKESIVVYIVQDNPRLDRRTVVKSFFRSDIYTVVLPSIDYNPQKESVRSVEAHYEAYQMGWCLLDAKEQYPSHSILFIKDSCLCTASQEAIDDIVLHYHQRRDDFDVGYLCKWEDKCHLHSQKESLKDMDAYIAKTVSPHGLQALLITPSGRDILIGQKPMKNGYFFKPEMSLSLHLNREIVDGNVDALCVVPNLFAYDLRLVQTNDDFLKANECEVVPSDLYRQGSYINQYIIILIIIILLIFIIWAAIKVSP